MSKFKVGDELYYIHELGGQEKYRCLVTGINLNGHPRVAFFAKKNLSSGYKQGHSFGTFEFPDSAYELAGLPLTKEQKIILKCKKLWNSSNYIKQNPNLAY